MRAVFLLLLILLPPPLGAQERIQRLPQVHEYTLENGLRLFVLPRVGTPTVSFVVQYRIGSVNETSGVTGIAHFLEHLLFKGTTSIGTRDYRAEAPILSALDRVYDSLKWAKEEASTPADSARVVELESRFAALREEAKGWVVSNEFDAILSENGARSLNAATTEESTSYYVELPANRAELWFALEADRMRNPVFREFYAERDVVAEERRLRLDTSPSGTLYVAHMEEAFRVHPYGTPVIGLEEDLESIRREDVEDYFLRYYGPDNAVVVIAGGVDPDQILAWAREYLEGIPKGQTPPVVTRVEPPQRMERRVHLEFDAEPLLRIGWRVPEATHPDTPALAMLASLLTGGRSSRIYRRLVLEERIASGVTSGPGPGYLYPGLFTIDAFPRSPHTPAQVEEVIYQEVERLKATPPEERELERVRNQLEAAEVRRLLSSFGLALQVAESAALFGDWRRAFEFTRRMEEVTAEDIQRVVSTYFRTDQRTVATLSRPRATEGRGR